MSNCLFFALWRRFRRGGTILRRKSTWGWWQHYSWLSPDGLTVEEYTPAKPNHHLLIPPPLYRGVVKITAAEQQSLLKKAA